MKQNLAWEQFQSSFIHLSEQGMSLDFSRTDLSADYMKGMQSSIAAALAAMQSLEQGAIANSDEGRMVGHYWLRNSALAPDPEIRQQIESSLQQVKDFSNRVHSGTLKGSRGDDFSRALIIGIGGSALGPRLVYDALGRGSKGLSLSFFDNTDPDGMGSTLYELGDLSRVLCIVISKSGSTPETANGMQIAKAAFERAGLDFSKHAVAVTGSGSRLHQLAKSKGWLAIFEMWDWVGGRTSQTSAVGLLPAALQGSDITRLLDGAREMDQITRASDWRQNPALTLALSWHFLGSGSGEKAMVVLPYKDRLQLLSQYLQQLVMESLGKRLDRNGQAVHQGLTVYGNKGSTDQHAYVQQLRDGINNFFAVFIEVLFDPVVLAKTTEHSEFASQYRLEDGVTCGDYLFGFSLGTRQALYEAGRKSITIQVEELSEYSLGALIALFERAVGFYAELVNINAYHQPGVEAGKKAAQQIIDLELRIFDSLQQTGKSVTAAALAEQLGVQDIESVFCILRHLAANKRVRVKQSGSLFDSEYSLN